MTRELYRYTFDPSLSLRDVEASLFLAALAAESLHGRSQVRLDASFILSRKKRSCVVDATTEVGRSITRIFTGFLAREFGEEFFTVKRVNEVPNGNVSLKGDLKERVDQFGKLELPDQPRFMHMGISDLVNDLWREVQSLRAELLKAKKPDLGFLNEALNSGDGVYRP